MNELHETSYEDNVDKQSGKQTKKRKLHDDYDDEEKQENSHDSDDDDSSTTHKKGKVSWSPELHHRFILAVNQLGIDKAVPRKILDLMKVENLTRENVASHLQKYRLHLKKVAASGNANPSTLRMGSLSGVGSFHTSSGSENFHQNYAFGSLPTSLNNRESHNVYGLPSSLDGSENFHQNYAFGSLPISLNNPASQNVYGLPSSETYQFGQAQNFNSFNNSDQLKLKSAIGEDDFYFGDPVQVKLAINQHRSPQSCVTNDVKLPKELITASSSGSSQESAEIAELRKELAATRYEHCKLKEMMVQQDRLIQIILQFVCPMQQPEPAFNLC